MKKVKKTIVVLGMLLSTILMLTGCGPGFEARTQEMLEHMNEKYGIELQVDWSSQAVTREYHSWNCSIKGNTDESERGKIVVQRWHDREDEPFSDNYFSIMVRGIIEERVKAALNECLEEYKTYVVDEGIIDNKYTSVDQLDECLEEYGNKFTGHTVKVVVPDQGDEAANEALAKKVSECLRNANIGNPYLNIFCVSEDKYEKVDRDNVVDINVGDYVYRHAGRNLEPDKIFN